MEIIHLDKSIESINQIYDFIRNNEYLLPDPCSTHVNLLEYSNKLNKLGETFVIKESSFIKGLISGYINDLITRKSYLQIFIVTKESQGKKYGTALMNAFIEYANRMGMDEVYLTVDVDNKSAFEKYLHFGFVRSSNALTNKRKIQLVYMLKE